MEPKDLRPKLRETKDYITHEPVTPEQTSTREKIGRSIIILVGEIIGFLLIVF
mgnify:CR=1 FL=1